MREMPRELTIRRTQRLEWSILEGVHDESAMYPRVIARGASPQEALARAMASYAPLASGAGGERLPVYQQLTPPSTDARIRAQLAEARASRASKGARKPDATGA